MRFFFRYLLFVAFSIQLFSDPLYPGFPEAGMIWSKVAYFDKEPVNVTDSMITIPQEKVETYLFEPWCLAAHSSDLTGGMDDSAMFRIIIENMNTGEIDSLLINSRQGENHNNDPATKFWWGMVNNWPVSIDDYSYKVSAILVRPENIEACQGTAVYYTQPASTLPINRNFKTLVPLKTDLYNVKGQGYQIGSKYLIVEGSRSPKDLFRDFLLPSK